MFPPTLISRSCRFLRALKQKRAQSLEWMKGICHISTGGQLFSPSLPGDKYLRLGHLRDLRAENFSTNVVRYDALPPHPENLSSCATSLQLKIIPYLWKEIFREGSSNYKTLSIVFTRVSFNSLITTSFQNSASFGFFALLK